MVFTLQTGRKWLQNCSDCMSGKQLFDLHTAPRDYYAGILTMAALIVGKPRLFDLLEEAERTGQRIELTYPIPIDVGPSEPNGIELIR